MKQAKLHHKSRQWPTLRIQKDNVLTTGAVCIGTGGSLNPPVAVSKNACQELNSLIISFK